MISLLSILLATVAGTAQEGQRRGRVQELEGRLGLYRAPDPRSMVQRRLDWAAQRHPWGVAYLQRCLGHGAPSDTLASNDPVRGKLAAHIARWLDLYDLPVSDEFIHWAYRYDFFTGNFDSHLDWMLEGREDGVESREDIELEAIIARDRVWEGPIWEESGTEQEDEFLEELDLAFSSSYQTWQKNEEPSYLSRAKIPGGLLEYTYTVRGLTVVARETPIDASNTNRPLSIDLLDLRVEIVSESGAWKQDCGDDTILDELAGSIVGLCPDGTLIPEAVSADEVDSLIIHLDHMRPGHWVHSDEQKSYGDLIDALSTVLTGMAMDAIRQDRLVLALHIVEDMIRGPFGVSLDFDQFETLCRPTPIESLVEQAYVYHRNSHVAEIVEATWEHHQSDVEGSLVDVHGDRVIRGAALPVLDSDIVRARFKDGAVIIEITDPKISLKAEGLAMGHCVGQTQHGHPQMLSRGDIRVFSYRDPDGVPQATWEIDARTLQTMDLQGQGNSVLRDNVARERMIWFTAKLRLRANELGDTQWSSHPQHNLTSNQEAQRLFFARPMAPDGEVSWSILRGWYASLMAKAEHGLAEEHWDEEEGS